MNTSIARGLFISLLACVLAPLALAQVNNQIVKVKGQGSAPYTRLSEKEKTRVVREAIIEAKKDALLRHVAQFNTSRRANYMKVEADVMRRIEEVVPHCTVLTEDPKAGPKLYSVVIEAGIDDNLIEQIIQAASPKAAVKAGEGSHIAFVFVARELATSVSFDDKRTFVSNVETERRGGESTGGDADAISTSRAQGTTTIDSAGGNTERKANTRKYRVFTVGEVDAAVNNVVTTAGYEVVSAADVDIKVNDFKADFETGDIQPETRKAALATCKANDIAFFGTASMDVGIPERDAATGMWRVHVTVNSQVRDLRGKFPRIVASIAGRAFAGLGTNEEVARTNALNIAASEMAAELVDQLRMKAVR